MVIMHPRCIDTGSSILIIFEKYKKLVHDKLYNYGDIRLSSTQAVMELFSD